MKQSLPITLLLASALFAGGCATKKYVQRTVDPVSGKLNQVASQTNQQGQTLDETRKSLDQTNANLEKDETALSATNERAVSADNRATEAGNRATEAMGRADQANSKADKVGQDLGDLKSVVANLDDYKQVAATTVNFKFDSDRLTDEAKHELDQIASNESQYKRFFIAVEGFTDSTGSAAYNDALSRRRADAVVEYLVGAHDIPIYRIHMVGLGKQKPVEDARSRAANAKNRRVEVMLFSADQNTVAQNEAPQQVSSTK
jgi:outer membrane protein OmpA-like peptidoglycan-associated protein